MFNFNNQDSIIRILRFIAVFGTFAAAFYEIFSVTEIKPNQHYSFYALFLIACGVLISLFILRDYTLKILNNPDFLVPIGLYITLSSLSDLFFQSISTSENKGILLDWSNLSFLFAASFLLKFIIGFIFAGWMTRIILQFVKENKVDLLSALKNPKTWLPRTAAVVLFGWLPNLLFIFLIIPVLFQRNLGFTITVIYPFILFTAVSSVFWNLATSMIVPHVLSVENNIKASIAEGIKISWSNRSKVFLPIILLMLVSGWIVFVSVTYNHPTIEKKKFGEHSFASNYSIRNQTNFSADFIWVGDYQDDSKWHKNMMKAVKEEPLETNDFRIMFLMLLLSVAVNIKIISKYIRRNEIDPIEIDKSEKPDLRKFLFLAPAVIIFLTPFEYFLVNNPFFSKSDSINIEDFTKPRVIADENTFDRKKLFASESFDGETVEDIFVGNFDGEDGIETVVVTRDKAYVYDDKEIQKSQINFNLGMTQDSTMPGEASFSEVKVLDFDGDGKFEFIGIGSYPYTIFIVDQKGEVVWKYKGKKIDIDDFKVADINNDRSNELIIVDGGLIKTFNQKGVEINSIDTKKGFRLNDVFLLINKNKEKAFLTGGHQEFNLYDLDGKLVKKIEKPTWISGFMMEDDQSAYSLYFDDNKFGIFDLDGNLKVKYEAPFSELRNNSWKNGTIPEFDRLLYVFSAQAKRFKNNKNGDDFLAVLATLGGKDYESVSMLYIYNSSGKIVYQELFDKSFAKLVFVPSQSGTGNEDIIILEDKNIWKYSLK